MFKTLQKSWFSRGFPQWEHGMGVLNMKGIGPIGMGRFGLFQSSAT